MYEVVTPANAGAQGKHIRYWIPAFAGMTKTLDFIVPDQWTISGTISKATRLMILMSGFTAGPAVSL